MSQQRLNMHIRKVSAEEQAHAKRIGRVKADIREQYRIIDQKTATYSERRTQQQQFGVGFGEIRATEHRLASILKPNRQKLAGLKRELIKLTGESGSVERSAAQQSDMFN